MTKFESSLGTLKYKVVVNELEVPGRGIQVQDLVQDGFGLVRVERLGNAIRETPNPSPSSGQPRLL